MPVFGLFGRSGIVLDALNELRLRREFSVTPILGKRKDGTLVLLLPVTLHPAEPLLYVLL